MKAGYVPVSNSNVLILGMAGAGKTSTKQILFGELPPDIRNSTPLAEPPVRVQVRDVSGVRVQTGGSQWSPVKSSDLQQIVGTTVSSIACDLTDAPESKKQHSRSIINATTSSFTTAARQVKSTLLSLTKSNSETPSQPMHTEDHVAAASTTPSAQSAGASQLPSHITNIHGNLIDLMEKKNQNITPEEIADISRVLGSDWIYFIDSGGQPHFHNLLPHFIQGISVALFTHRLCDKLDDHPIVEYYEEGQQVGANFLSPLTTEDTIKCLVRSMQSHRRKEYKN